MVRDEVGRKINDGPWGAVIDEEMEKRKYDKVNLPELGITGYQNREWRKDFISENAASHWIAIRHDNFNDGFDAGLEWCMMQLRAHKYKGDAMKRIQEELDMG